MSTDPQDRAFQDSLHPSRHAPKPSLDTNASGIADSTISFSAFPNPPSSIPSTPLSSTGPSLAGSTRGAFGSPVRPLVPVRRPHNPGTKTNPVANSASSIASSAYTNRGSPSGGVVGGRRPLPDPATAALPRPWNDGASQISGISVDGEDRLLPTSFITSLLQENKDLRKAQRRNSSASDALSGISEMTYPPPEDTSRYRQGGFRGQPSRLGAAPPSSFAPIPEATRRVSSDSDTLHSTQGHFGKHSGYPMNSHGKSLRADFPTSVSGHDEKDEDGFDDDSIMQYKAALNPPPLPPPAYGQTQRRILRNNTSHEARQSVHSLKSIAPSFISRISVPASIKRLLYGKKKPLPPVPLIPDIPIAVENQYRRQDEAAPINELVSRAGQLHGMLLEKEYGAPESYYSASKSDTSTFDTRQTGRGESWQPLRRRDVSDHASPNNFNYGFYETQEGASSSGARWGRGCSCFPSRKVSRRVWIIVGLAVALVVIVAIVVPVVITTKAKATASKCEPGLAGTLCDLNASCVCTADEAQCNGLAQSIVDIIPLMNEKFASNYSNAETFTNLWLTQGTIGKKDCADQAWLIDTGKNLNAQSHPERTRWAQAALLWHVIRSHDVTTASAMQRFVYERPWADLGADGPTDTRASDFTSTFAGYSYNFAGLTVTQPLTTFVNQGVPVASQVARVGDKAQAALDRMYSYALASSSQREVALRNYWTTTLSQRAEDLGVFKGVLARSPVLLPFNGSSSNIRNLYSSSSLLFPPPLACYPGFSPELMDQLQTFETTVFNLDSPAIAASFDAACFPDRPIYGILDLLRLRLPYLEGRPWLPRQAAVLDVEALPRAVVYVNEMMSASFPGSTPRAKFTPSELDPRNYGTLNLPNHVILQYLSSMPVGTAKLLAEFVVGSVNKPAAPPDRTSPLFQTLSSVPPLEVAVFGNIGPTDVSGTVSSFTTASGAFFFGTEAGAAMRNWSIRTAEGAVVWAENSTSPRVVRDNSLEDPTVDQAWRAVAASLGSNNVGLSNLTTSFETTRKFSPS